MSKKEHKESNMDKDLENQEIENENVDLKAETIENEQDKFYHQQ